MNLLRERDRPRRSLLFVPGSNERFLAGAGRRGADALILDLEDAVTHGDLEKARLLVRDALAEIDFHGAERIVRVNAFPDGIDDLEAVLPASPDLILLPKVESADAMMEAEEYIVGAAGNAVGRHPPGFVAAIETALGVERALEIASASDRTVALMAGLEDYTADLGVEKTREGLESLYARMRIVNAARAAGMQAIDSIYGDYTDLEGLAVWAHASRGLGFCGMGCVHPAQIPVVHKAFSPTHAQIDRALRIRAAYDEAVRSGRSVASVDGTMVDPPVARRAERILRDAQALGLLAPDDVIKRDQSTGCAGGK